MYIIIPLNEDNLSTIQNTPELETNSTYMCGINTISKLLAYSQLPIKNKDIAIKNILQFLKYIDNKHQRETTIIPIHRNTLINYFTRNEYQKYMKLFQELEIITRVPYADGKFYEQGKRSMQYRIHNQYLLDPACLVILDNQHNVSLDTDTKYPVRYEKTIKNVTIDYIHAILSEFEYHRITGSSHDNLRIRINRMLALNNCRFIKKGNNVNRIYHSLSNITRISRFYLSIDGLPFYDIDIKNCQPLLLCYLILSTGMKLDDNYLKDCETGCLYERFMGINTRDETKVLMYQNVFFDFKPNSTIALKFKELYPNTYQSLLLLNKDDLKLAGKLQNIEASIFNNLIPKKSKFYYTLFDSIYFTDLDDCSGIIKDIKSKFAVYNINPVLTINGGTDNDFQESL